MQAGFRLVQDYEREPGSFRVISTPMRFLPAAAGFLLAATLAFGQQPTTPDIRLGPPKTLDGYFPFEVPASRYIWEKRADDLRVQLRVSLGLWPWPSRTPLNAVVHGRIQPGTGADYTVEKVFFESMPGFFVTGSLYRPIGGRAPVPGVLCPHGHWTEGRFMDAGPEAAAKDVAAGGELDVESARSVLQTRCVGLARAGCVVLLYDMIGYADAVQLPFELAHRFKKRRPEMETGEGWGLYTARAEAHGQSVMGLQTWNSIRALDFLTSLPDVDPHRIGVTGASGGATQTFILGALDSRVSCIFPAVMVSTAMQGGCRCENACGLRIGTGNVELAGLFAPKPLGMTAANDWTKEMETKGFPELQELYNLYQSDPEVIPTRNVRLWPYLQFPHNFNNPSRMAMYGFFGHLRLDRTQEQLEERPYQRLSRQQQTVWETRHPVPPGGPDFERKLLAAWRDDVRTQLHQPGAEGAIRRGWEVIIGRSWAGEAAPKRLPGHRTEDAGLAVEHSILANSHGEIIPVVTVRKAGEGVAKRSVLWLHQAGKTGLFDAEGHPVAEVRALVESGCLVMGADLMQQGGQLAPGTVADSVRRVAPDTDVPAFTYGYNHPLFIQRVHDVLTCLQHLSTSKDALGKPTLVAPDVTGPIAAVAHLGAGSAVERSLVGDHAFRFEAVASPWEAGFLPGAARFGDLPGVFALLPRGSVLLVGDKASAATLESDAIGTKVTLSAVPRSALVTQFYNER